MGRGDCGRRGDGGGRRKEKHLRGRYIYNMRYELARFRDRQGNGDKKKMRKKEGVKDGRKGVRERQY